MTEPSNQIQWIRVPGPGEMRHEGTWMRFSDMPNPSGLDFAWFQKTNYLATHVGAEPPTETRQQTSVRPAENA